jgi:hypothetical protein
MRMNTFRKVLLTSIEEFVKVNQVVVVCPYRPASVQGDRAQLSGARTHNI